MSRRSAVATDFNYQEYLASRDWAILREKVRERAGDRCERGHDAPMQATHHLTYERIGHEWLEDLQAVCNPCHEYLSGKREDDPAARLVPVLAAGVLAALGEADKIVQALEDTVREVGLAEAAKVYGESVLEDVGRFWRLLALEAEARYELGQGNETDWGWNLALADLLAAAYRVHGYKAVW